MPHTNVDISREKGLKCFQKNLGTVDFMKKMGQKNFKVDFFVVI
jgi:hypothetical protein